MAQDTSDGGRETQFHARFTSVAETKTEPDSILNQRNEERNIGEPNSSLNKGTVNEPLRPHVEEQDDIPRIRKRHRRKPRRAAPPGPSDPNVPATLQADSSQLHNADASAGRTPTGYGSAQSQTLGSVERLHVPNKVKTSLRESQERLNKIDPFSQYVFSPDMAYTQREREEDEDLERPLRPTGSLSTTPIEKESTSKEEVDWLLNKFKDFRMVPRIQNQEAASMANVKRTRDAVSMTDGREEAAKRIRVALLVEEASTSRILNQLEPQPSANEPIGGDPGNEEEGMDQEPGRSPPVSPDQASLAQKSQTQGSLQQETLAEESLARGPLEDETLGQELLEEEPLEQESSLQEKPPPKADAKTSRTPRKSRKGKRETKSSSVELPKFLWTPGQQEEFRPFDDLPPDVQASIQRLLQDEIGIRKSRRDSYDRTTRNAKSYVGQCLLEQVIGKGASKKEISVDACTSCLKWGRPCFRIEPLQKFQASAEDSDYALCLVPLPAAKRVVNTWKAAGYWVQ